MVPSRPSRVTARATRLLGALPAVVALNSGVDGQGVGIASIDTGVDESSGDFEDSSTGASRVVARVNSAWSEGDWDTTARTSPSARAAVQ